MQFFSLIFERAQIKNCTFEHVKVTWKISKDYIVEFESLIWPKKTDCVYDEKYLRCAVCKFVLTKKYFISYLSNLQVGVKALLFIFNRAFSICIFFAFISIKGDVFKIICNYIY